jgi:hypothetical protein
MDLLSSRINVYQAVLCGKGLIGINKFRLVYVIQTKPSKEDHVFIIGVAAGECERRLQHYLAPS